MDGYKRRGGREAEGGGLLNRCTGQNLYRGFESPPLRQFFVFNGLDSFLKHFLRIPHNSVLRKRGILMAGKFSIYKYVKLEGKGWRYARAAYHPNGKIKPDAVLVKGLNGKNVEEKHPEGSYFLNFNNTWIPVRGDALEAQHQRKLKLNQVEYERLRGKTASPRPNLVQLGRKII